ncbi:hypothetical protein B0A50_04064 [Salinomyces thailandicus]|uniref:Uncharacterized protein n=1 Tax=Salinomyces thailandicus TaxID=706561 RepID=A0A4U0TZS0_9PEZI|nr:hypothetical protein B0A50_04064 [Salinomyces thailandica]
MSLKEAYYLAHTAQCRLNMEASRADRNLRFVVGHLMHYESLRLRIVEIEHELSRHQRAKAVQFQGAGSVGAAGLQRRPSTGDLRRKSPPPPVAQSGDDMDDDVDDDDEEFDRLPEDDEVEGLGLQRFPSGAARPSQPPPDLEPDDDEDYSDEEPVSPEEPDEATLERAIQGKPNEQLAQTYESVRRCTCQDRPDAPAIERMWEIPGEGNKGRTRAVVEVADG